MPEIAPIGWGSLVPAFALWAIGALVLEPMRKREEKEYV
jgi:hypothetical protein